MTLLVFAGAPLTQTFYGFILLGQMIAAVAAGANGGLLLGLGIASGVAMALSAIAQGKAGAAGADALSDTGKGFANYVAVVGLCETVALFAMVLSMTSLSGGVGTPELGMIGAGLVMGIAALGSAIGIGIAGSSTIASWKRSYKANKPAPMTLLVFAGAPLTQTFYGFILMGQMIAAASRVSGGLLLGFGVGSGVAMALSAIAQGKAGAAGSDALGDTGKGFANYIAVVGLCETVALFAMVLSMTSLS
jgi:V/A-type H+-transporting ATPase subunit K